MLYFSSKCIATSVGSQPSILKENIPPLWETSSGPTIDIPSKSFNFFDIMVFNLFSCSRILSRPTSIT